MNNNRATPHPLFIIAALSLILFSLAGIATMLGWLPLSKSDSAATPETLASATAPAAPLAESASVEPAAPGSGASKPAPEAAAAQSRPAPARPAVHKESHERAAAATAKTTPVAKAEPAGAVSREPAEPAKAAEPARAQMPAPAPTVVAATPAKPKPVCRDCGVIEEVRAIEAAKDPSGVGAVAGGVAGAVLGRQVGGGRGRDLMTVVGAVGGAVAGHEVEKRTRTETTYEIIVRFNDGTTQKLTQSEAPQWRPGDRVRVVGGQIRSND